MELRSLCIESHEMAKSKGFWDARRNVGELLMLITSELGEAMEAHRKGKFANMQQFNELIQQAEEKGALTDEFFKVAFESNVKDSFEDEIADALIRLADMCEGVGIADKIEKHIALKMRYNETRERLHGKMY